MNTILLLATLFTWFNTGLIWTIQLVHYPGFAKIGAKEHPAYHSFHMQSITPLVGPAMLAELLTTLSLLFFVQKFDSQWIIWLGAGLVGLIWLHTAFIAVPFHNELTKGFSVEIVNRLVQANWWRTFFWTLKSILFGYLLWSYLR